jgi:hypothetical protein
VTYHIYNGDRVTDKIIWELNIIKSKYRDPELQKAIDQAKDNIIQYIKEQSRNIEIRGTLKQRINTFRAGQLECPDIRRWWYEMEWISLARSDPSIEQFLKDIYKNQYPELISKIVTYKSLINDIKYRMDIIVNGKYSVTNPDHRKFIHETEQKIARVPLINEEVKKIGLLFDTFTSMGDMTVPSTTLQQARTQFRKIEYEQTDRRETAREYMIGGGGEL